MAWIEQGADGGLTTGVIWRPAGARATARESETFSVGSDAQNLARADGFKRMVDAAGQRWPEHLEGLIPRLTRCSRLVKT